MVVTTAVVTGPGVPMCPPHTIIIIIIIVIIIVIITVIIIIIIVIFVIITDLVTRPGVPTCPHPTSAPHRKQSWHRWTQVTPTPALHHEILVRGSYILVGVIKPEWILVHR